MSVLVIAEHDNQTLKSATLNTIAAATKLSQDIHVLVIGHECQTVADQTAKIANVKTVHFANKKAYQHFLAENMAELITQIAGQYTNILAPASTFGKNLMPRVAALLDVGQVSDVIAIESENTFKRPIYAGNAIATVKSHDAIKCLTIRSTAFEAITTEQSAAQITAMTDDIKNTHTEFVSEQIAISERPELTSAKVVISGGRGLKSQENFVLLENIAKRLNAAIGASRAAVDAGFAPNDLQVGQTGKVVAPDLYIAVGISGAIQHIAGMKDSKVIVAINKDPEAPIFQVADYGLVADLFEALPELDQQLADLGY